MQVEDLISIELAYINTNHPDFVGGTRAAYESMTRRVSDYYSIITFSGLVIIALL